MSGTDNNRTLKVPRGVAITPPIIGRIAMGHQEVCPDDPMVAVPFMDDHFSVTTLAQRDDLSWEPHPIQQKLLKGKDRLVRIPVRLAYNDPSLSLISSYKCRDDVAQPGQLLCQGNGFIACRATPDGVNEVECPTPAACPLARAHDCRPSTRFFVKIEGQNDDLGVFQLSSSGRNTLNYLAARMRQLAGACDNRLAGMPLMLEIKRKTRTLVGAPFEYFYADLVFRPGDTLASAIKKAEKFQHRMTAAGVNLAAMEEQLQSARSAGGPLGSDDDTDDWFVQAAASVAPARRSGGLTGLDQLMSRIKEGTFKTDLHPGKHGGIPRPVKSGPAEPMQTVASPSPVAAPPKMASRRAVVVPITQDGPPAVENPSMPLSAFVDVGAIPDASIGGLDAAFSAPYV